MGMFGYGWSGFLGLWGKAVGVFGIQSFHEVYGLGLRVLGLVVINRFPWLCLGS